MRNAPFVWVENTDEEKTRITAFQFLYVRTLVQLDRQRCIRGDKFHRKLSSEWTEDVAMGYVMIVRSLVWNGNYRVYNHDGQTTQFLATLTMAN